MELIKIQVKKLLKEQPNEAMENKRSTLMKKKGKK